MQSDHCWMSLWQYVKFEDYTEKLDYWGVLQVLHPENIQMKRKHLKCFNGFIILLVRLWECCPWRRRGNTPHQHSAHKSILCAELITDNYFISADEVRIANSTQPAVKNICSWECRVFSVVENFATSIMHLANRKKYQRQHGNLHRKWA